MVITQLDGLSHGKAFFFMKFNPCDCTVFVRTPCRLTLTAGWGYG
ncbi:hypothetical protein KNU96_gp71 [Xanthomonas phage FoX5]|uniref:Uncharacterized protein n=1 Tax=Xanthomonas phage FoX5 TaxID=2723901 RepID=A0A858NNC8_9CAUD|nr:hypothetical protein KNU96_gp71 [Xanthomonas phage FoX5]QJB22019.1 hypothetical protein XccvBFoX5_gp41c [Xanthomonas phage FoX5]